LPDSRIAHAARRAGVLAGWILASTPPGSGSVVMATGIVSIAFYLTGWRTLSVALLVVAAACWLVLAVLFALRLVNDLPRVRVEARDVAGLTSVAATGVLGTRLDLAGWPVSAVVFCVIALAVGLVLMPLVPRDWPQATTGSHFLVVVATQAVAILAAVVTWRHGIQGLVPVAFALLCLGLVLYGVVLARFPPRELLTALGDHWVAGGASVISALAAATLVEAIRASGELAGLEHPLQLLDLALWSLSMLWLVVLAVAEALRPRVGYHALRWATVFPLGMYAAMSFVTGTVEGVGAFRELARWLVWIAFAAWCLAALGLFRRARWLIGSAT
jgi:tellurite resistance protein TehA-like permease